jgi:hypothetical protein
MCVLVLSSCEKDSIIFEVEDILLCLQYNINALMMELNPSTKRCLTRFFTGDFASWTVHFINICVKNQQIYQLFIQFINYVW